MSKVNLGYAFAEHSSSLSHENLNNPVLLLREDVDYTLHKTYGYAHYTYTLTALTDKAKALDIHEAALLADDGNLCFGGRGFGRRGDVFTGVVHTD